MTLIRPIDGIQVLRSPHPYLKLEKIFFLFSKKNIFCFFGFCLHFWVEREGNDVKINKFVFIMCSCKLHEVREEGGEIVFNKGLRRSELKRWEKEREIGRLVCCLADDNKRRLRNATGNSSRSPPSWEDSLPLLSSSTRREPKEKKKKKKLRLKTNLVSLLLH